MSLTPRDVIASAVEEYAGADVIWSASDMAGSALAILSALSRAGFALVPRALLESAADIIENEWPNGGDNAGMRAVRAMRACLNAHQEPTK